MKCGAVIVKYYSPSMLDVHPSAPNTGTGFLKSFKGSLTDSTSILRPLYRHKLYKPTCCLNSNTLTSSTTLTRLCKHSYSLYKHPHLTTWTLMAFKNFDGLQSHIAASIGKNSINPLVAFSNSLKSSTTLTRPVKAFFTASTSLSHNYLNSYGLWKLWRPPRPSCGLYRHSH